LIPRLILAAIALVASGLVVHGDGFDSPRPAQAGGILLVVDTPADENGMNSAACSLREAITAANGNSNFGGCLGSGGGFDGIQFSLGPGTPTINITASPLPDIMDPVVIDGGPERVELRGPGGPFQAGFNGLTIASTAPGTTIRGLVINSFPHAGISVSADSVQVLGNRLGTDSTGTIAMPNITGLNQLSGSLLLVGGPTGTTPGGACTGDCNLISGNDSYGINVAFQASTATVQFNFLGVNLAGDAALGNGLDGLATYGGSGHLARANVVSGNGERGVRLAGAQVTATDNIIGANSAGDAAIPNGLSGLTLDGTGVAGITGNLLSGNGGDGLDIFVSSSVQVKGNRIGVAQDGATPLPNQGSGVRVANGTLHLIGDDDDDGNTIAFNGGAGVSVDGQSALTMAAIRGNSIHSNASSGIDNINGGNTELAPPIITGLGSVHGTACASCIIDVFSDDEDEGRIFEGFTTADANGGWTFDGAVAGPFVTATATDAAGNTSEFSAAFDLTPATPTPTPSPTPSPTLTPTPTSTPTTATPTPTSTPASPTATPTPTPTPSGGLSQGDNDCDGDQDAVDALVSLQENAGLQPNQMPGCPMLGGALPAGGGPQLFGDIDCDGDVDAVDALQILRFVAGLTVNQQEECTAIGQPL
jgi:CSLREA domain-containing protein